MGYPSDLTDEQWNLIEGYFQYGNYGNRSVHDKRLLVNAVFYIQRTGCQWRMLPSEFPRFSTVYSFFKRAKQKGIWEKINADLVALSRQKMNHNSKPSYCIIDSQSVKTTSSAQGRGIDGGKKIKGRKRHIVTDTHGHLLHAKIHPANIHDTKMGWQVFQETLEKYPSLKGVCADSGYNKTTKEIVEGKLKKNSNL